MLKTIGTTAMAGVLGVTVLALPAAPAIASTPAGAQAHIQPGRSCPNPAVWNKPVHTKKYGWLECTLDPQGMGWHYRHIPRP